MSSTHIFYTHYLTQSDPSSTFSAISTTFHPKCNPHRRSRLNAWQIKISFNPAVLNVQNVTLPPDHIFYPHSITGLSTRINNTIGTLTAFNGLWETTGVNGSGTLCQITFTTLTLGSSSITFTDLMQFDGTYLVNSQNTLIPFDPYNTTAQITAEGFQTYAYDAIKQGITYQVNIFTNATPSNFNFNETTEKISFYLTGPDLTTALCSVMIPKQLMNTTFVVLSNATAIHYTVSHDAENHYLQYSTSLSTKKSKS